MDLTIPISNYEERPALCEVCGTKRNLICYPILPFKIFQKRERDTHSFICSKCAKELYKLMLFVENNILREHEYSYKAINAAFLDNKNSKIKITTKKEIIIYLPLYDIIKSTNGNGRKKGNNGHLKDSFCQKCLSTKNLTVHHPYKRAVFGENGTTVTLCSKCHREVEETINNMEREILRQMKELYYLIYNDLFKKINIKKDTRFKLIIREVDNKYTFSLDK